MKSNNFYTRGLVEGPESTATRNFTAQVVEMVHNSPKNSTGPHGQGGKGSTVHRAGNNLGSKGRMGPAGKAKSNLRRSGSRRR